MTEPAATSGTAHAPRAFEHSGEARGRVRPAGRRICAQPGRAARESARQGRPDLCADGSDRRGAARRGARSAESSRTSRSATTTSTSGRRPSAASSSPTRRTCLTEATAELTWALILTAARRIGEGERLVRRGAWKGWAIDFMLGTELRGKQLGIIGRGRIGRAVAAKAPAFGMTAKFAKEDMSHRRAAACRPMSSASIRRCGPTHGT